jgi:hypothetical protein
MPSRGGLGVDGGLVAVPGQPVAGDVEGEVLGHLVLVDHPPGPQADLVLPGELACRGLVTDLGEQGLGGGEEVFALAGPLSSQQRVAAGDEPLAGVVRMADLGQVLLVEEAELQRGPGGRGCRRRRW